jgi:hypothetical protein
MGRTTANRILLTAVVVAGGISLLVILPKERETSSSPDTANSPPARDPARPPAAAAGVASSFSDFTGRPETSKESLAELEMRLRSLPTDDALAEVTSFLRSGRDKDTGLPFEIGPDGMLTTWPTFRVFLLDLLEKLDPAAAAEIAREILSTPTTADEWALALRTLGRSANSPENDALLRAKTLELIRHPAWQADPSVGYLNAFDVLVHTRAVESTPLLSTLIQDKDRKDLAHASFLTLDRLVQLMPAELLEKLTADTELQASRPEMTAQQFARADLRVPAQRQIVESWLLDPARSATELNAFAGTYPNHNQFVSNNLLTSSTPHTGTDLAAHDREALEILTGWQDDPSFEPVAPYLATMVGRLKEFVNP